MSDTLFGKEISGTPLETREATSDMARMFQQQMQGQVGQNGAFPFGRLQADAASMTSPLFASMEPFESRALKESGAQIRETMSGMGGRFGTSANREVGRGVGETVAQLARVREETLLNTLMGLGDLDARRTATMAGFLAPGPPQFQQGIAGDLLTAGGTLAGYLTAPGPMLANQATRSFESGPRFNPFEQRRNIFEGL